MSEEAFLFTVELNERVIEMKTDNKNSKGVPGAESETVIGDEMNEATLQKPDITWLKRVENLDIPDFTPLKRYRLEELVSECSACEPETMVKVAEFFSSNADSEFCQAAANFWYYRAWLYSSEKAKEILCERYKKTKKPLPTVTLPVTGNESGERLYALGFSFFKKSKNYYVSLPDENGIVEVKFYVGSSDADEDGYGCEEYYDWWFLDENYKVIPAVKPLMSYSKHDKHTNEDRFTAQYNQAVRSLRMSRIIRQKIEELFEKYKNENSCDKTEN